MIAIARVQQAYDHRLKLKVFQGDFDPEAVGHSPIPRSTLATWKSRPPKPVVSLLTDTQTAVEVQRDALLIETQRLRTKLAAMRSLVMLLLTVLRLSRFTFEGIRLPDGRDKKRLIRSVQRASDYFTLSRLLRPMGLSSSRYYDWINTKPCELTDVTSCPRAHPTQVTSDEQAAIGSLLQDPEYSHIPTGTLVMLAQRLKLVYASASTWYRLMRQHHWRRPRKRIHPSKPTVGIRTSRPNAIWHVDISVVKLLDGTRVYLQAVMDNFSRKVLAYRVSENYEPTATATLLEEAASCLPPNANDPLQSPPAVSLYCDGGVENFNDAVDQVLSRFQMQRVQAQIDIQFSNSMIEAFWRSTKHNCLFQQKLDAVSALCQWTDFYVRQHNEVMPHSAFKGQTPDEMFFGTGKSVEADLRQARVASRQARIEFNRKRSCGACPKTEPELHKIQLDKP
jgi:putative transposase